ncbi:MAG: hypothetical protein MR458_00935 [Erysipelotrichaceae bacterium]|nr:hypothetical protein [Erysipelotrichaceae bacterium]
MIKRNERIGKMVAVGVLIIAALFMLNRAKYGYIYNDEPFILTLSHRLIKGDAFLYDEWQPTQLTGFLNYPWMILFTATHNNTDGMILFFRYVYVILNFVSLLFVYLRLSNYSKKPLITGAACLYLLLFSSMDILTVSYNFYSLTGLLLFITLCITGKSNIEYLFAGIFFSVATLVSPYLAIVFVLYYLFFSLNHFVLKKDISKNLIDITKMVLFGVILSVAVFICFLYGTGGNISKMLNTVSYIFTDVEYPSQSIFQLIYGYLYTWVNKFRTFGFMFVVFVMLSLIDKKHKTLWLEAHIIAFVILTPRMIHIFLYQFNYLIMQIGLLGIHALIIDEQRNNSYSLIAIAGVIFSFILYATSDLKQYAIANGMVLAGFASFFLIDDYLQKYENNTILIKTLCILLVFAQIGTEVYERMTKYYLDRDINDNLYMIKESAAKGLYVDQEQYDIYMNIYKDINDNIPHQAKLLVLSQEPWIYLLNDSEYCTYSAWMTNNKEFRIKRLKEYYDLHPDKYPNYIYVLCEDFESEELQNEFPNFSLISTDIGYILKNKDI